MKHKHTWKYQLANECLILYWCDSCGAIKMLNRETGKTYKHKLLKTEPQIPVGAVLGQPVVRENLANYAHEAWIGWMKYLFAQCIQNSSGTMTIPKWAVDRWNMQVNTPYKHLPEEMKRSDRAEADKIITTIKAL